jgi:hypothetical protein
VPCADVNDDVSQEQKPARKLIDYVEILNSTPVADYNPCKISCNRLKSV